MRLRPAPLSFLLCVCGWLLSSLVTAASPPGSPADHFLSYKTRTDRTGPAFTQITRLPLADAFGSKLFDVKAPADLLLASSVDGNPIADPATHLRAYKVKVSRGEARFVKRTAIAVTNALGTLRVDASKPDLLLVPSALAIGEMPPSPAAHGVDEYACYTVAVSRGEPRFPKGLRSLADNLLAEPALVYDVVKPKHLCLPTSRDSRDVKNPSGALMCYQARRTKGRCAAGSPANPGLGCTTELDCGGIKRQTSFCATQPKAVAQAGLAVANDLGGLRLASVKESELCLPSIASLLPVPTPVPSPSPAPEVCGDGVLQPAAEQCDPPGSMGSCPGGFACTDHCQCPEPPICGNGRLDAGEGCDGAAGSCPVGSSCGNDCACIDALLCGDGELDPGEDCDPPGDAAACAGLGCLGGCRCAAAPPIAIAGRVVEVGGAGLADVTVRVGLTPLEVLTDADGYFHARVGENELRDGEVLLRASADGYSEGFERVPARLSEVPHQVQITLQPAALAMTIPDPAAGIDAATPEVRVSIAPDALGSGNPVALEIVPLDPTGEQLAAFPGTDFLAAQPAAPANGNSGVVPLESVVLLDVRITDLTTGERVSDLELPATIELRLPDSRQGLAVGETIPWWSFDEDTARWIEGGLAEIVLGADGAKWARARAAHFSWWNVDYPVATHACVKYRLVAPGAAAVDLTRVLGATIENASGSWAAMTRFDGFATADGSACATVKRGEGPGDKLRIRVFDQGTRYLGPPVDGRYPLVDDAASAMLFDAPTTSASCTWNLNTENCTVLGDLVLANAHNLAPIVTLQAERNAACAASDIALLANASDPDEDEPLSVEWAADFGDIVPVGVIGPGVVMARWLFTGGVPPSNTVTATVTVTDARGRAVSRTVSIDYRANCCPVITEVSVPNPVDPRVTPQIELAASAVDPDASGPLTYDWSVGGDVLSGPTVLWSVRSSGLVRAQLAVSDGECTTHKEAYIAVHNRAPSVRLDQPANIDCAAPSTSITAHVADPDGDPVTVTWSTTGDASVDPAGPVPIAGAPGEEVSTSTSWTDGDPQMAGLRQVSVAVEDQFGARAEARRYFAIDRLSLRISSLVAPRSVRPGTTIGIDAVMDANLAVPSSFEWSAEGGVLVPAGASAQWTAPAEDGRYVIRVQAANPCAVDEEWIAIDVDDDLPVVIDPDACATVLSVTPASGAAPLPVELVASTANAFPVAYYWWIFGDGGIQVTTENRTTHTYAVGGTFAPSVTVTSTLSAGGQTFTRTCSDDASLVVAAGPLGTWSFGVATGSSALCPGTSASSGSLIHAAGGPGSNTSGGGSVCTGARGNFSVASPFELSGGVPDANGIAPISLSGARIVRVQEPSATSDNWICLRIAPTTPGWVDCDGGSDARVQATLDSQTTSPPGPPAWDDAWLSLPTGQDSGPGAARLPISLKIQSVAGGAEQCPEPEDLSWDAIDPFNTALTTGQAISRVNQPRRCPDTVVIFNCPTGSSYESTMPSGGHLSCAGWGTQSNVLWKAPYVLLDRNFGGSNIGDLAVTVRLRTSP